jgi:hypothetical protein
VEQKDRVWALESQQADGGEALRAAAKDFVYLCAKSLDYFPASHYLILFIFAAGQVSEVSAAFMKAQQENVEALAKLVEVEHRLKVSQST